MNTQDHAHHMRQLIDSVQNTQPAHLAEAKPYSFLQMLRKTVAAPFNPNTQRQLVLNQYANTLYQEWNNFKQLAKRAPSRAGAAAGEATGRDFIEWYSTSPVQAGRADPISSSILKGLMQRAGITLDQPIPDDKLSELCVAIAGAVAAKTAKISLGLIRNATAAEEEEAHKIMDQLDSVLISNESRLSLNLVYKSLLRTFAANTTDRDSRQAAVQAVRLGWRKLTQRLRNTLTPLPITPFLPNNTAVLNSAQKTALVDILPDLILSIVREQSQQKATRDLTPIDQPTAPRPQPTPAEFRAKYDEWERALAGTSATADDIMRLTNEYFSRQPT